MAAKTSGKLDVKRVYDPMARDDGRRILVDRLWPRGLSKQDLDGVVWMKDVAPSAQLRKWFGHRPERWTGFRARYLDELRENPAVQALRECMGEGPVTLLYGAHDPRHNHAVVLAEYLRGE